MSVPGGKVALPVEGLFGLTFWAALPVALVSTVSLDGHTDLAPMSLVWFAAYTDMEERAPCRKTIAVGMGDYSSREVLHRKRTYRNIVDTREFVVNIPSAEIVEQANATVFFNADKFAVAGLTPQPSLRVQPPSVAECRLNYECRLERIEDLGNMTEVFWGEVVAVRADPDLVAAEGENRLRLLNPIYHYLHRPEHGSYFALGEGIFEEPDRGVPEH
jgi:flavin reductase (DIM6/NTAB) family NADH-FMN oxidoreductase RutF